MKKTYFIVVTYILIASLLPASIYAVELKLNEVFKTIEVEGRPHLAIAMREVLGLSLLNSRQFQESQNQAKNAYIRWKSQSAPADVRFTTSLVQQQLVNAFEVQGADFLSLSKSEAQVLTYGINHKTNFGLSYGLNYSKATQQSFSSSIVNSGDLISPWSSSTSPYHKDSLQADIKLSLLKDFGSVGHAEEEKEKIRFEQSTTQLQAVKNTLIQRIGGIYWDLVEVHDNLHSMQQAKESAQKFYDESKLRSELGELSTTEVKLSQLQLALAEQNLLNETQRKSGIEDQIKAALQIKELDQLYSPTEKMEIKPHPIYSSKLLKKAYQADPTLQNLQQALALENFNKKQTKNRYQSSLDLKLQYQLSGYGREAQVASNNLQDPNSEGYIVSLTWDVPLFDYKGDQQVQQANMNLQNLQLNIDDQKDLIKLQLQALLRNLRFGEKSIRMTQISIQLNQEIVDKEIESFRLGHSTSYRVSQVQDDLSLARLQATQANTRYEKAYLSYLIMVGNVNNYYNLKIESLSQFQPQPENNPLK